MRASATMLRKIVAVAAISLLPQAVMADITNPNHYNVFLTEICPSGPDGIKYEYVEVTNVGTTAQNMSGWSQDDNHNARNTHSMTGFGVLQPGESAILTEADPTAFRTMWGLDASVKVISYGDKHNLAREGDTVNLWDNAGSLVDQIAYPDGFGNNYTAHPTALSQLGTGDWTMWEQSQVSDPYGSHQAPGYSNGSFVGSPGTFSVVPEPGTLTLLGAALAGLLCYAWRKMR